MEDIVETLKLAVTDTSRREGVHFTTVVENSKSKNKFNHHSIVYQLGEKHYFCVHSDTLCAANKKATGMKPMVYDFKTLYSMKLVEEGDRTIGSPLQRHAIVKDEETSTEVYRLTLNRRYVKSMYVDEKTESIQVFTKLLRAPKPAAPGKAPKPVPDRLGWEIIESGRIQTDAMKMTALQLLYLKYKDEESEVEGNPLGPKEPWLLIILKFTSSLFPNDHSLRDSEIWFGGDKNLRYFWEGLKWWMSQEVGGLNQYQVTTSQKAYFSQTFHKSK